MKIEIIDGIKYNLVPAKEGLSNCRGCCFKNTADCSIKTNCCKHGKKYGVNYIYKLPKSISVIWIIKEKESGLHIKYCRTRQEGRNWLKENEYWSGFSWIPKVIVKGMVQEQ